MTFGEWLTSGIEMGIFIYGLVGFYSTHDLNVLAVAGFSMAGVGYVYALLKCVGESPK